MALSSSRKLEWSPTSPTMTPDRPIPVKADDIIYTGAFLHKDGSGDMNPLVAGQEFGGISMQEVDNTGGAAAAKTALVRREGLVKLDVAGATSRANEGDEVFASDDGTATLTSTSNSKMGRVEQWISGTTCWVRIWARSVAY